MAQSQRKGYHFRLFAGLLCTIIGSLVNVRSAVYSKSPVHVEQTFPTATASTDFHNGNQTFRSFSNPNTAVDHAVANHALSISRPGDYLLTDWPISNLLENDFTMELWYRTPFQPENTKMVALISNLRDLEDAAQYERDFGIYLDGKTGQVVVEFHGYEPVSQEFVSGRLESNLRIDDGQWHLVRVVRNGGTLTMQIDGNNVNHATTMPIHHDYDSQEQRVVLGGFNGRQAFRHCQLDNVRIWSRVVGESPSQSSRGDPNLMMHLSFDDVTEGIAMQDCAWHGNGAIRMGTTLRTKSAFVPARLPDGAIAPSTHCSSWPGQHQGDKMAPKNDTLMITYLKFDCERKGSWFIKGHIFEREAYVASLWLDANRLGMPLLVMTECVDLEFRQIFTTPYVTFQEVHDASSSSSVSKAQNGFTFQVPSLCRSNHGGEAYMKRFLVFDQMISQGHFQDAPQYLVHLDFRDSRVRYWPEWKAEHYNSVGPPPQLWLQSIQRKDDWVCGGFQAGTHSGMTRLMSTMSAAISSRECEMAGENDQDVLNRLYKEGKLDKDILIDGGIINSQITRRFDNATAFSHGHWWMSKNKREESYALKAYPMNVPYYPSS